MFISKTSQSTLMIFVITSPAVVAVIQMLYLPGSQVTNMFVFLTPPWVMTFATGNLMISGPMVVSGLHLETTSLGVEMLRYGLGNCTDSACLYSAIANQI